MVTARTAAAATSPGFPACFAWVDPRTGDIRCVGIAFCVCFAVDDELALPVTAATDVGGRGAVEGACAALELGLQDGGGGGRVFAAPENVPSSAEKAAGTRETEVPTEAAGPGPTEIALRPPKAKMELSMKPAPVVLILWLAKSVTDNPGPLSAW